VSVSEHGRARTAGLSRIFHGTQGRVSPAAWDRESLSVTFGWWGYGSRYEIRRTMTLRCIPEAFSERFRQHRNTNNIGRDSLESNPIPVAISIRKTILMTGVSSWLTVEEHTHSNFKVEADRYEQQGVEFIHSIRRPQKLATVNCVR
jgi:hypothetical protein